MCEACEFYLGKLKKNKSQNVEIWSLLDIFFKCSNLKYHCIISQLAVFDCFSYEVHFTSNKVSNPLNFNRSWLRLIENFDLITERVYYSTCCTSIKRIFYFVFRMFIMVSTNFRKKTVYFITWALATLICNNQICHNEFVKENFTNH